jgi:nitronate monooxygenase
MRLLGIDHPILQSGMGGVAGSALTAAVSNAGALGILAGHGITPGELTDEIDNVRRLTGGPFGINVLLPQDLIEPSAPSPDLAAHVNAAINPLRQEVGLSTVSGLPKEPAPEVLEKVEIILRAQPAVFSIGLGDPGPDLVERCHRLGIKVVAMATSIPDALALEESGVDAVVIQGAEAGGHRSHFAKPDDRNYGQVGSMVLIPEAVDALRIPVIAAGGITDGRGLVAALALGASAVMIGTRFIATAESLADDAYKQAVLDAQSSETTITDVASGRYARMIRNRFTDGYGDAPTLPFGWQCSAVSELFERSRELEDSQHVALWAGQSAGRVHEIQSAESVIQSIVAEATEVSARIRVRNP